jgi:hypothetical protein
LPEINPVQTKVNYIGVKCHPTYIVKRDIWFQIAKSYAGGVIYKYSEPSYLHRFSAREPQLSYEERKKRAVYFNNVQPLADMLTGFIFSEDPIRNNVTLDYLEENANLYQCMNQFMRSVAVNSLMMTCGVLVDSPSFDPEIVQTAAQRKEQGLNPFCKLYMPWSIRDFHYDSSGTLQWLVLDNTTITNENPFDIPRAHVSFRLWTPEYFQDFTADLDISQDYLLFNTQSSDRGLDSDTMLVYNVTRYGASARNILTTGMILNLKAGEQIPHPCKCVPFVFCNWNDKDNTHYSDTIFEDIALFDQSVFNYMSLMDEMLSGGVFKYLFFPGKAPTSTTGAGLTHCSTIEYDPTASHEPRFDGPSLGDVQPFINAINFYLIGIKRSLGLDTDQEKSYAQSGAAKAFDFTKVKALLDGGAEAMEHIECKLFRFAGLWEGKVDEIDVEYRRDFLGNEQEEELLRMFELIALPYREMKRQAARRIANLNFNDVIDSDELDLMYADIDETEKKQEPRPQLTPAQLAEMQKLQGKKIPAGTMTDKDVTALEGQTAQQPATGQDAGNNTAGKVNQ